MIRFFWRASVAHGLAKGSQSERLRRKACAIKELLIELGPIFIKVGQFLSTRRDALPPEIVEELSCLQDRVPAEEALAVRQMVKDELGANIEEIFGWFEAHPIASASIGQVHRALLADGTPVVLKIQRPGLSTLFCQDLGYMRLAAKTAALTNGGASAGWLALCDEFGKTLYQELDYIQEGRNADRMRSVLRDYPQVKIPRVNWKYTRRRVLTLEYLPGTKIDNLPAIKELGVNLRSLACLLVDCYLTQVVGAGFFHADPHAGNLAVDEQGCLIIYDFGMVGELSECERKALSDIVSAVCRRDASKLARCLVELGVITSEEFEEKVARLLAPFFDYWSGAEILAVDFTELESEFDELAAAKVFCLPAGLAYVLRTGSSLEGIARTLKPGFSFACAAQPFVRRLAIEQGLVKLTDAIAAFAQGTVKGAL